MGGGVTGITVGLPLGWPRSADEGPSVSKKELGATERGSPVPKPRFVAVGAVVCPNAVGAMEKDPPRDPAVGAIVAPGKGAAVGDSV